MTKRGSQQHESQISGLPRSSTSMFSSRGSSSHPSSYNKGGIIVDEDKLESQYFLLDVIYHLVIYSRLIFVTPHKGTNLVVVDRRVYVSQRELVVRHFGTVFPVLTLVCFLEFIVENPKVNRSFTSSRL